MAHRAIPPALFLILSLCTVRPAAAADTVRVIAAQAAVHLNADPNSLTVATVPAGTVLEVNGRQGAWYQVWLPAEREGGPRRLGFLAASDGELIAGTGAPGQTAAPPPLEEPPVVTPQRRRLSGDFDGFGGVTLNLPGARAIVVGPGGQVADSGERNVLPTFGLVLSRWFGSGSVGVFVDFSGVDFGSAFAQVGNNRSEASGAAVDFHGGWQFQYPGRIRPYVLGGVGVYFQKSVIDGTLNGVPVVSIDQTDTFLSYVFGGGVRFMIGEKWGARVGLDALSVKQGDEGYLNYGRFAGGTFLSF